MNKKIKYIWLFFTLSSIKILRRINSLASQLWKLGCITRGVYVDIGLRVENPFAVMIGENVNIQKFVWLNAKRKLSSSEKTLVIHNGSYIGSFCQINAFEKVIIEEKVLIGDRVLITDSYHNFDDKEIPIIDQGDSFRGAVVVGAGTWIGSGAVVLANVKIGKNCIVGANAVVTKSLPDYSIAVGNPAQIVKFRN
jgi:acetyltransferase-like isoleucine patch superfamily enzyme